MRAYEKIAKRILLAPDLNRSGWQNPMVLGIVITVILFNDLTQLSGKEPEIPRSTAWQNKNSKQAVPWPVT